MGYWLRSRVVWGLGLVLVSGAMLGSAADEPTEPEDSKPAIEIPELHDDFETPGAVWQREHTDTTINLLAQERSERAANDGRLSERFQFEADQGSQFFVSYPLPKVPVTESLEVVLNVRSNRSGAQLFVRVVLPSDVDPDTRAASFVLVPGTVFDRVDRWQRLEVPHLLPSIERQARVLRASSRRPGSLEGAYVDRVGVNLMGGVGGAEGYLDNLVVRPVPREILATWSPPGTAAEGTAPAAEAADGRLAKFDRIRLDSNQLRKIGGDGQLHEWFPTAIDAAGADVNLLRQYGFDVLVDDLKSDPERIQTAVDRGFRLIPKLSRAESDQDVATQIKEIESYKFKDDVAFWMAGEGLGRNRELKVREDELARTRKLITAIRAMPPKFSRLTTGIVEGDLPLYARSPGNLDTIGINLNHWGAGQDPLEFYQFLVQRPRLSTRANAGQPYWAWLPTSGSESLRRNIWGEEPPPGWGVPRVLPEQLRLMTYMALSAGYRGLGFQGDADLTRPAGRPLLIEMALLNMEIDLMETFLARSGSSIPLYSIFDPDPPNTPPPGSLSGTKVPMYKEYAPKPFHKAASISVDSGGALLLLADYSMFAQYQPHQMAAQHLVIRAVLPESAQAFLVSPGGVEVLDRERAPGGTNLRLPEFDVSSMILCTTDMDLKDRLEAAIQRARPMAVQLAIEQAELMYRATAEAHGRLAADGHTIRTEADELQNRALSLNKPINEVEQLLAKSEASIKSAREAQERLDFPLAWAEARRAHRPLRILAYSHWVKAFVEFTKEAAKVRFDGLTADDPRVKDAPAQPPILVKPASLPPLVSFSTLPEAYIWLDWIKGKPGYRFGANRVPSGGFDDPQQMSDDGWMDLSYQMEGIESKMTVPQRGKSRPGRMLSLSVAPKNPADLETTLPGYLDFPAAAVRSPAVAVSAGNLIRISVLVRRPIESVPGQGGIIIRDSIGGEQLQYRNTDALPLFCRVVLYRKAPADGEFTVTLGLAGYGLAQFDDFRVELVEEDQPLGRPGGGRLANDAETEADGDRADAADAPADRQPPRPDPELPAAASPPEQNRVRRR